MIIDEQKGDLFNLSKEYTLVHCISEDCAMGAGIAVAFERKFQMRDGLRRALARNQKHFPCAILYTGSDQKVINMITKEKYWHKPTYDTFDKALDATVKICKEHAIKKIAMPKIGCGLDRLDWIKVKAIIEEKFKDMDIEIQVRYL